MPPKNNVPTAHKNKLPATPKTEERPNKRIRLYGSLDQVVLLIVGGDELKEEPSSQTQTLPSQTPPQKFYVHQNVLCKASPYFRSVCLPSWTKPEDRVIRFPDDDAEVIQSMVNWMYEHEIYISETIDDCEDGKTNEEAMLTSWGLFAKLFVLGEKYQMRDLQNDAIDALLQLREDKEFVVNYGVVPYIYANTPSGSPLRSLFVRIARCDMDSKEFAEWRGKLCADFVWEMAAYFFEDRGANLIDEFFTSHVEYPDSDFCASYHVHDRRDEFDGCEERKGYTVFESERGKQA